MKVEPVFYRVATSGSAVDVFPYFLFPGSKQLIDSYVQDHGQLLGAGTTVTLSSSHNKDYAFEINSLSYCLEGLLAAARVFSTLEYLSQGTSLEMDFSYLPARILAVAGGSNSVRVQFRQGDLKRICAVREPESSEKKEGELASLIVGDVPFKLLSSKEFENRSAGISDNQVFIESNEKLLFKPAGNDIGLASLVMFLLECIEKSFLFNSFEVNIAGRVTHLVYNPEKELVSISTSAIEVFKAEINLT